MATNREVFDSIAATWYGIRHWPLLPHEMEELASRWSRGSLVNLGCGAGADFLPFRGRMELVGLDLSRGMLMQSTRHTRRHSVKASLVQGDLVHLPFADTSFDWALGIASYHHIEGDQARSMAFAELRRVLRTGGEAFLSVWNHDQPRFQGGPQDRLVPWGSNESLMRYYHLYTARELRDALSRSGFEILRLSCGKERSDPTRTDIRNIYALVRKPASPVTQV